MNKSFHYCCIRAIAERAGFSGDEAETLAYASQYVDDASEHKPMRILGVPRSIPYARYQDGVFDPICTAHAGKNWLGSVWKWAKFYMKTSVQKKILIPFHFVPDGEWAPSKDSTAYDFVTRSDSRLCNALVARRVGDLKEAPAAGDDRGAALVALGVSLHTYADTWAHAGFSGRHNSSENDVQGPEVKSGGKYRGVGVWERLISYGAPDIGHSELSDLPDRIGATWKATYAYDGTTLRRDNLRAFLRAAKSIYRHLSEATGQRGAPWNEVEAEIRPCLAGKASWGRIYPHMPFHYDRYTWRRSALKGGSIEWDNFDDADHFAQLRLQYAGKDKRWFWFHMAALEQREFLMQRIPQNWTV